MELREIRTFLQIAQKQSFSKAAEALGYSQAAVTVQIKQLEEELGIHLFDRLGKKTVLTHHGEIFYRYAVTILGTVADAKKAVSASTELSGDLTIGTIESICESIFPASFKEIPSALPERLREHRSGLPGCSFGPHEQELYRSGLSPRPAH